MTDMATTTNDKMKSALLKARAIDLPSRDETLRRSYKVQDFWRANAAMLVNAWREWEAAKNTHRFPLNDSLLDPNLRDAVNAAWQEPDKETLVKTLWKEVSDGVFEAQFFDPSKLQELRGYLETTANSGIPARAPYGIALNRHGVMLDPRSEGYLAAPAFQDFYQVLMSYYMRPIARLLFPGVTGYDSQTFGFTIQYQSGMDTSLQPHTDASAATLNINMNLPDEPFTGSQVDFYDRKKNKVERVVFEPGRALIHRGNVLHTAQPITSGTRSNMVLWLYGKQMQIPPQHMSTKQDVADVRWRQSMEALDTYAPF